MVATDSLPANRFCVIAAELSFQHAVDGTSLLLFSELDAPIRELASTLRTRSRRKRTPLKGAFGSKALLSFQVELVP